jgi:hypothetical protein
VQVQLAPQLQEEGPEHWQGPILIDGCFWLRKEGIDFEGLILS